MESIEFSDPELVSVSKVEEDTTVGAVKDGLGLECEYSAEMTDEMVAEIGRVNADDGDIAQAIADHWWTTFLDDYYDKKWFCHGISREFAEQMLGILAVDHSDVSDDVRGYFSFFDPLDELNEEYNALDRVRGCEA